MIKYLHGIDVPQVTNVCFFNHTIFPTHHLLQQKAKLKNVAIVFRFPNCELLYSKCAALKQKP